VDTTEDSENEEHHWTLHVIKPRLQEWADHFPSSSMDNRKALAINSSSESSVSAAAEDGAGAGESEHGDRDASLDRLGQHDGEAWAAPQLPGTTMVQSVVRHVFRNSWSVAKSTSFNVSSSLSVSGGNTKPGPAAPQHFILKPMAHMHAPPAA
jgi:hypothetical protein